MNYFVYLCKLRKYMGKMQENKVHKGKRIGKILLWAGGIWLAAILLLQVILSPAVLTRILNDIAAKHVDGEVSFGKARISMFRHFPNIGLLVEDCSVTYPSDRYDSLEQNGAQGLLLRHGAGDKADTLASFRKLSISINAAALITGKISIPHAVLVSPRIFAHSYDESNANWNIFLIAETEKDSTSNSLPDISVGRIRFLDHPHIVYTDSRDTMFVIADMKKMTFNGKLDTRRSSRNKIEFTLDSLLAGGRIASDTLGLRLDMLHMHEHQKHLDIHAEAKALLATRAFGRMHIPIGIQGTAAFRRDSMPALLLHGFKADIAAIPLDFDAEIYRKDGQTEVECRFDVEACKAEDLISGFIGNIIPETQEIRTDAVISINGTCSGPVGNGLLPEFEMTLAVPETSVRHKGLKHEVDIALNAGVSAGMEGGLEVAIEKIRLNTYGLQLEGSGKASDITGADPAIHIDGAMKASADSLSSFLPEDSGIATTGNLNVSLSGSIRKSQMNIYSFGMSDMKGHITGDNIMLKSPKDSIDISIGKIDINAAPETKTSRIHTDRSFRLLGITAGISDAEIKYKESIYLKGSGISVSAKNSADAFSDSTHVHHLGGRIKADNLTFRDASGMSVTLDQTSNSFQMVPKEGYPEIPVLSLSSSSKRIYLRDETNRMILTDAGIKGKAAINTVERRLRRKAILDSLAKVYPDITRDSLFARARADRENSRKPLEDDVFKSSDLNFTLDGMLADYFRKWDINGRIDVRTGILMTPYLPLRNILKGMSIRFSNNEVDIDSLKFMSGASEISAKGAVTGLRRALLGRGRYKVNIDMSSGKMDADELLAAFNAGSTFNPAADKDKMAGASDAEFLKMVVADSLENEDATSLIVIPADIEVSLNLDAGNISFSDLMIDKFQADMTLKERCLQILDAEAETNMGKVRFDGFYATRTKEDIRTGFDLSMTDVTSEKVIGMMPAIDTIMPLLKSFKGLINCEMAATARLDTNMNILTPSINGVVRIDGENLTMSDNEMFSSLAKKLKFKNSRAAAIKRMTVEGLVKDNVLEIFPFVLELDRYTLALSGLQYLDMSYRYHASIIRSPIVFKVGVDIYGSDFDHMKFKIGRPKYRNTSVPVFTAEIDKTRINLAESIKDIFAKGVDMAIQENESQEVITEHKTKIGYINAADQQLEELTEEELRKLEEAAETETQKDTLRNEQPGIH